MAFKDIQQLLYWIKVAHVCMATKHYYETEHCVSVRVEIWAHKYT